MAMNNVHIKIPGASESAQAYLISPGSVEVLNRSRVPGGVEVTISDFSTTALILVTTDFELAERIEAAAERVRPLAVQMAIEQARLQYAWVSQINEQILAQGHTLYDENDPLNLPVPPGAPKPKNENDLLMKADASLQTAQALLEREEYAKAWSEARSVGRSLRHLMHSQWSKAYLDFSKTVMPPEPPTDKTRRGRKTAKQEKAETARVKKLPPSLISPVCCPPLLSYSTVPLFDYWLHWIKGQSFGSNLMPTGTFDDHGSLVSSGWTDQSYQYEGLRSKATVVPDETDSAKSLLKLTVEPVDKKRLDDFAILDFPAAAVRSPAIPVEADQFYRITVFVKKPAKKAVITPPGAGGLIVYDSLGGEGLQYRSNGAFSKSSKLVFFRYAPARGELTVTLGLAGVGEICFDNLTVERLERSPRGEVMDLPDPPARGRDADAPPETARRPSRSGTNR
jgi:hypothetical protein